MSVRTTLARWFAENAEERARLAAENARLRAAVEAGEALAILAEESNSGTYWPPLRDAITAFRRAAAAE